MLKRPTSLDIAVEAGVSQSTVSRVINRSALVSDEVRQRVLDAATRLHYKVDTNARLLRSRKVYSIALLVLEDMESDSSNINPFFLPMIGAIATHAADRGYDIIFGLQREANDWGASYSVTRPAEGIIFLGSKDFNSYAERFRGYNHSNDCWVVWGLDHTADNSVCVASDNFGGAREAVRHLASLGRRRIAYLGKLMSDHWEFIERLEGYKAGLNDAGLPFDPALCIDSQLTLDDGAMAAHRLVSTATPFDAIFASTDILAIGAMRYLFAHGIPVPDQVAIIGFDDMWLSSAVWPRLSTVRQDTAFASRMLVDSVAGLIEGETVTSQRIPTQLVIRESCGARR